MALAFTSSSPTTHNDGIALKLALTQSVSANEIREVLSKSATKMPYDLARNCYGDRVWIIFIGGLRNQQSFAIVLDTIFGFYTRDATKRRLIVRLPDDLAIKIVGSFKSDESAPSSAKQRFQNVHTVLQ